MPDEKDRYGASDVLGDQKDHPDPSGRGTTGVARDAGPDRTPQNEDSTRQGEPTMPRDDSRDTD